MAVDLRQTHFRFGKDDGTESTHTFWQNEDTNHTQLITADWTFLLRFTEQEVGGTAAGNTDAQFQYNKNGAGWQNISTTSGNVKAVAVAAFTNGATTSQRLSGTGTFSTTNAGCTEDGSSGGTANDIPASGNSETEAGLQVVFANVANGDTLQFRFNSPDWTVTYDIIPTLTITISVPITVTPDTASLNLTLYAPSIALSDNQLIVPSTLAIVLTAYAPTVTTGGGVEVIPDTLALSLTFYAPTINLSDNKIVTPDALALTTASYTPTISVTDNKVVTPDELALVLSSFAPVVSIGGNITVTPSTLALLLTTYAPVISAGDISGHTLMSHLIILVQPMGMKVTSISPLSYEITTKKNLEVET